MDRSIDLSFPHEKDFATLRGNPCAPNYSSLFFHCSVSLVHKCQTYENAIILAEVPQRTYILA